MLITLVSEDSERSNSEAFTDDFKVVAYGAS